MSYEREKKYETFEFKEEGAEEGEVPTSLRVRRSLPGHEMRVLEAVVPTDLRQRISASDIYPVIAEHIQSWNIKAIDTETGKLVNVPVPTAEHPDDLSLLPDEIVFAVFRRLRSGPVRRVEDQAKN